MTNILAITLYLLACACSDDNSQKLAPPMPPLPASDYKTVNLTINPQVKSISEDIFGYNTQSIKGPGWTKTEFLNRISELDPSNFRYPGGTIGNFWDWKEGYYNQIGKDVGVIKPSAEGPMPYKIEDIERVYERSGSTATPIYMLNMLTSTYEYELAMLKQAQSLGLPIKYIELGNEFYLDDHPEAYPSLKAYPEITDYTDTCRIWATKLHAEFPQARIAMIGVSNPSAWGGRPRAKAWNGIIMNNDTDIPADAMTIHIYAKDNSTDPTPADMLSQSLNYTAQSRVEDPSIEPQYKLWVTEYNFDSGTNKYSGLWVHGLASTLMSAQLITVPQVELICFFNLTASQQSAAIYDADIKINGKTVAKYSLSASGEGLKMLAKAQKGATSVRIVGFSDNPTLPTQKNGNMKTRYGYIFSGKATRMLLVNAGPEGCNVSLTNIGFTPKSFETIYAPGFETEITAPSSLSRKAADITSNTNSVTLEPFSITVIY